MRPGRPTDYKKKYCEMLVEHMAEGLSFESFAGVIDKTAETLYNWCKKHPEFFKAKKRGVEKSRLYWERKGRDYVVTESWQDGKTGGSKAINSAVWKFNMKNRFNWRDSFEANVNTMITDIDFDDDGDGDASGSRDDD